MNPSDLSTIVTAFPQATGLLAMLPLVQLVAKLLAPLPARLGGFNHSTIWSRFFDTVAAFPAAPAPRAAPPEQPAP